MSPKDHDPRRRHKYVLLSSMVIAVLFCVGEVDVMMDSTLPMLQVYYLATKSKAASTLSLLATEASPTMTSFPRFTPN